ncbi:hypothetical protein [Leucobacter chromiiresistens]|uniref:Alternate signal-mediated exported protein, RER_14450 family n=1 Tax=Leucobacter chromiiresistens TaxID=1079994 RepID=A0A1H1BD59_9MICO|nr:hypothetical protein [Leucobacter chromiiresistens]SDQ49859.1 hypothetical protein SAMN04488565_2745 [Leucobacter chromiiresistens]
MEIASTVHGKRRVLLAGGALLAAAGLVTAAAFSDFANLNLGNGTDGGGIGGTESRFNIQVVGTDDAGVPVAGTWQEADTPEGVNIAIPGADLITPGDTISVEIPFRNESPRLGADINFSLQDRPGFTSDDAMASALRYSVALGDTVIADGVTQAEVADLDLGVYESGAEGVLKVSVALPDQGSADANNALQGQTSYVQANFDATSVQP